MKTEYEQLEEERDRLFEELTKDWDSEDKRYKILSALIDIEIEMEKVCNQ